MYIEHLQELYNNRGEYSKDSVKTKLKGLMSIAAQAVADSPKPTPVAPPAVSSWDDLQPDALSTSMSDEFGQWMSSTKREEEDPEGPDVPPEEDAWEPMQEAMEAALDQGWTAWRQAQRASPASGALDVNAGSDFLALPEAPSAALPAALPAPLRFMDHADAASYVAEGAPPSPPRVMIR